jgi:hypothetical protein
LEERFRHRAKLPIATPEAQKQTPIAAVGKMSVEEIGLIVPDVHEKIVTLERLLKMYEHATWVLFLGDFLDAWEGLTQYTHKTCRWLRDNVDNPKYRFLYGNHDIQYAWPLDGLMCSGYTVEKQIVVNNYLKREHWDRFRLMGWVGHGEDEWLCTHAGIHPNLLHPVLGYDKGALLNMENRALAALRQSRVDELVAAGHGRGGPAIVGGVDWLDWDVEFQPIDGLNQIVGHTPGEAVRSKTITGSRNYCVDTNLNHVVLLKEGKLEIEEIV